MSDLPEVGVGLMYFPGLEELLETAVQTELGLLDVIEVEAQPSSRMIDGRLRLRPELRALLCSLPQPKLVHSVGFPVAGTVRAPEMLAPVVDAVTTLRPPWASEHVNFDHVPHGTSSYFANFLLPAIQSDQVVEMAAGNVQSLASTLGVPIAIETPVNYLRPYPGELRDGEFYAAVADRADCGLLVDLHNLWCNERNGRQPVLEVINDLPLDRIWEIHLAGGRRLDGYWVDAHSGMVAEGLWELAHEIVTRLPNLKAIIFEVMPEYLEHDGIAPSRVVAQLERMRELWARRATRESPGTLRAGEPVSCAADLPDALAWEITLGACMRGAVAADELSDWLAVDPGVGVYRKLISSVRIGTVVELMPLTYRLLTLVLGEADSDRLLRQYIADTDGRSASRDEVAQFRSWLAVTTRDIASLVEVADFELAGLRIGVDGRSQSVRFTREPLALLRALGAGVLPPPAEPGDYILELRP